MSSTRTRRRTTAIVLAGSGLLVVAVVVGWQLNAALWTHHSSSVGKDLVQQLRHEQAAIAAKNAAHPRGAGANTCTPTRPSGSQSATGVLVAPSIGLVAPVLQGTANSQLDVAVGHDPNSVWPGANGNAVLLAHDVSYFVHLDSLKTGETVRYETACRYYDFVVASHAIVRAGSPVYDTTQPTLTLVTCWPTNALWFTPDRYLVTLLASGSGRLASSSSSSVLKVPVLNVPAPPALVSEGLTLATNPVWMGTLSTAGSPSRAWLQSPGPLFAEEGAIEAYLGGLKSLAAGRLDWWTLLAPSLAPPPALRDPGTTISYGTPVSVTVDATGDAPHSVELRSNVVVSGGLHPGSYDLDVVAAVRGTSLTLSSWSMKPA